MVVACAGRITTLSVSNSDIVVSHLLASVITTDEGVGMGSKTDHS
jgi:hypothetical protein